MKDQETKERFIELRAKGLSYAKIAEELKTSKQTLIDWGAEFKEEIENLRAVSLEALQEQFLLSKEKRLEAFGGLLQRIGAELQARDLGDVDTPKLFDMFLKTYATMKEEAEAPKTLSEKEIELSKRERESDVNDMLTDLAFSLSADVRKSLAR